MLHLGPPQQLLSLRQFRGRPLQAHGSTPCRSLQRSATRRRGGPAPAAMAAAAHDAAGAGAGLAAQQQGSGPLGRLLACLRGGSDAERQDAVGVRAARLLASCCRPCAELAAWLLLDIFVTKRFHRPTHTPPTHQTRNMLYSLNICGTDRPSSPSTGACSLS